jgi:energy-coupling factor transporter transmembrane protein EcfT
VKTLAKALLSGVVGAATGFFLGTFFGILSVAILRGARNPTMDYAIAYQFGGLSLAALFFTAGFVLSLVRDFKRLHKPL